MKALARHCNLWRNYNDMYDTYEGRSNWANRHSLNNIITYWSRKYTDYYDDPFMNIAGAGQWNDPGILSMKFFVSYSIEIVLLLQIRSLGVILVSVMVKPRHNLLFGPYLLHHC